MKGMEMMLGSMLGVSKEELVAMIEQGKGALQQLVVAMAKIEANTSETLRLVQLIAEKEGIGNVGRDDCNDGQRAIAAE